jgi:hypothetical protein
MKHDKAYDQPTNVASAGATAQPGKDSSNPCDAIQHPTFQRNGVTTATAQPDSKLIETRELQLGSNGYQSNGFSPKADRSPAPVRGFGETDADKGLYQGK